MLPLGENRVGVQYMKLQQFCGNWFEFHSSPLEATLTVVMCIHETQRQCRDFFTTLARIALARAGETQGSKPDWQTPWFKSRGRDMKFVVISVGLLIGDGRGWQTDTKTSH